MGSLDILFGGVGCSGTLFVFLCFVYCCFSLSSIWFSLFLVVPHIGRVLSLVLHAVVGSF